MLISSWLSNLRSVVSAGKSSFRQKTGQRRSAVRSGYSRPAEHSQWITETLEPRAMLTVAFPEFAAFPEFVDPNPNPGNLFGYSVVPLSTGNVVISSLFDDAGGTDTGAVYLFNGATGALISTLVGMQIGNNFGEIMLLDNGNYLLVSPEWNLDATHMRVGAVTFGSGTTGVSGVVSPANSLVGSATEDSIGYTGVVLLTT